MRTYLDCIPCFFDQALRAARMATKDEKCIKQVLDETGEMLKDIPLESTPPMTARLIYAKVAKITGCNDPYCEIKHKCTEEALTFYPHLKELVWNSTDRLLAAIRISIAGNSIDYGPTNPIDLQKEFSSTIQQELDLSDYKSFRYTLDNANDVLYIGDNAGETVADRVLIEEIKKPVTYAVRGAPVINDAILDDARQAGLDQVAALFSSGTNAPGAVLRTCSHEFNEKFQRAGIVIAKGQGNYEALSDENRTIFFLLKVKCDVLARHIGAKKGDLILKGINMLNPTSQNIPDERRASSSQ